MWFRRKYNLAPNDPRYLDATIEEIITDYWENFYYDNPNAAETETEDEDFDLADVLKGMESDDWEEVTLDGKPS